MAISFKELKRALRKGRECILALEEDEDGGIAIAKNYGEGTSYSASYSAALADQQSNPEQLFIRILT